MYRLRLLILVIVVWLVLFLNIERPNNVLNLGHINLSPAVYYVAGLTMFVVLLMPELARYSFGLEFGGIILLYLSIRLGLYAVSIDRMTDNYVTYVELGLLALTLWLTRRYSSSIVAIEHVIDQTVVGEMHPDAHTLLSQEQAIADELLRARRYAHSVTVLYIRITAYKAEHEGVRWDRSKSLEKHYWQAHIAGVMRDLLLDPIDRIMWTKGDLLVCLPEKPLKTATAQVLQIKQMFEHIFNLPIDIGLSCFPNDALVLQDLIHAASQRAVPSTSGKLDKLLEVPSVNLPTSRWNNGHRSSLKEVDISK